MAKLIPGIHNYCDRWCERCAFVQRCAVGIEDLKLTDKQRDINNKEFWDTLSKSFEKTFKLLEKAAKHYGIDINEIAKEDDEEFGKKRANKRERQKNHFLFTGGTRYADLVHEWLGKQDSLKQKGGEITRLVELGIKSEKEALKEINTLQECLEVVNWYSFQISVKFARALSGKEEDDKWFEENDFPKDSDGSAKVALIGIDRSMAAWAKISEFFPEREDEVLTMLGLLDKLRRVGEEEFPDARKFKRPGFDD
ncbi:MAG: hypothetical protein KIS94_01690 [Chitinophagales bacterium]|nr:hypothetical protein [Chitinophagales bacterium]